MTTDQPLRAVQEGLIGRYGTLDPSDGNLSQRYSLSLHYATTGEQLEVQLQRVLHPQHHDAVERLHALTWTIPSTATRSRRTRLARPVAARSAFTLTQAFGSVTNDLVAGVQLRYDSEYVDRKHTLQRVPLDYCSVAAGRRSGAAGTDGGRDLQRGQRSSAGSRSVPRGHGQMDAPGFGPSSGCARNTTGPAIRA